MLRPETGYRFRNWDETLECRPKHLYRPESEEEILEIVREASDAGETVRTFGAGHSWAPHVVTDDTLINLDRLDRIVSVDAEQQRVTVQAGIRIKELNRLLPKHGLAMKNLGSIGEQSIAGAISTATHGTGLKLDALHTQVVGIELLTGSGRRLAISENEDPELMAAARVSLGALGVITQVTMQCVSYYKTLTSTIRPKISGSKSLLIARRIAVHKAVPSNSRMVRGWVRRNAGLITESAHPPRKIRAQF
jgi:FAD/FMN-containing dehydrogenase